MEKHRIFLGGMPVVVILLFLWFAQPVRASVQEDSVPFSPKELIFEHITDRYLWRLPLLKMNLYLPVLVKERGGEWHLFSSRSLADGTAPAGFTVATEGNYKDRIVGIDQEGDVYRPLDFSITKNVAALFLTTGILLGLALGLAHWYQKKPYGVPRRLFGLFETSIEMLYKEILLPVLGKDTARFAPYLLTLFYFILIANLVGLIAFFPGGTNLTGNLSITMVLAFVTFLVINLNGTREYWREIFWPDVPLALKFPVPLLPIIEVFGLITKPVALMIRLFANVLSGHLITLVLLSLIFVFATGGIAVQGTTSFLVVFFDLFMMLVDLLICVIQAYVFFLLSTIFIAMARIRRDVENEI